MTLRVAVTNVPLVQQCWDLLRAALSSVVRVLVRKRPDAVFCEHHHGILCGASAGLQRGSHKSDQLYDDLGRTVRRQASMHETADSH